MLCRLLIVILVATGSVEVWANLFMLAMRNGLSLGNLIAGTAVSFLGVQHTFMANGILAIIVQIFIFWRFFGPGKREVAK